MSSREKAKAEARAKREAQEAALAAADRRKRRLWTVGGVLVLAIAIVGVAIALSQGGKSEKPNLDKQAAAAEVNQRFVGIPQTGATLGNPNAPLVMEEFGDLQCPFCAEFAHKALPTIVDKYVRTGKLQIVFHPFTIIGPDSQKAHDFAAGAAQQNKMWQFVDLFYLNQKTENSGYVTDDFLKAIGGDVTGLNTAKAMKDGTDAQAKKLLTDAQNRAQELGVSATPSFTLSRRGVKPSSLLEVQSLDASQFTGKIDEALKSQ